MEVLKVSSHSSPNSVAGAIAGVIREKKMVEVHVKSFRNTDANDKLS